MNPLGHFLIGYVTLLFISLVITRIFFEDLKYWTLKRYLFFHQLIAVCGGVFAEIPDIGDFLGVYSTDKESWANFYFYHYDIDMFYHELAGSVRTSFEIIPVILLGSIAFAFNFWAIRKIIRSRVKANQIGKRLCNLADEYVGGIGPMIVQNVVLNAGYTLKSISTDDVSKISDSLGEALGAYTGELMAKEIRDEMNSIVPIPLYYEATNKKDVVSFYSEESKFSDKDLKYFGSKKEIDKTLMYTADVKKKLKSDNNKYIKVLNHLEDYTLSRNNYLPVELMYSKNICGSCRRAIDDKWIFCPHCQSMV